MPRFSVAEIEELYQEHIYGYKEPCEIQCGHDAYLRLIREIRDMSLRWSHWPLVDESGHYRYNNAHVIYDPDLLLSEICIYPPLVPRKMYAT